MSTRALLRPLARGIPGSPAARLAGRRTFALSAPTRRATDNLNIKKLSDQRSSYERDRMAFLAAGALAGVVGIIYTSLKLKDALAKERGDKTTKMDTGKVPTETFTVDGGTKRKVVVHDADGNEIVPTGNSTVPTFPRTIDLSQLSGSPDAPRLPATTRDDINTEYTLVGLGLRSVTFLGIQVYVVGFYVATADIATLQNYLVKRVNKLATTLVSGEKDELRAALLNPTEGEETWDTLLRQSGVRTVLRIAPVRDTDFPHLRDGFIRAIAARSQSNPAYNDDAFGEAIRSFKSLLQRGKVPKDRELLLCRDAPGRLIVLYDDKTGTGRVEIGRVVDERLSRLLWLNYLAGSKVASEPARQSIIDGIMEFVERPVGTVAAQVV
ncbi:unnamed protein product [Parascedosporium putredinis]|uniref:Chalcone isomerase domain-containing protein n=1 Tax=Parascedosporium putredinis TaxID=1442378 RepID=A0A9P1GZW1_9PEZI|nr:unnamed protein product [Parascedosporium putredinis]CAI7991159.1 unnamed protein product [Parascedosporium putredinis]